MASDTPRGRGGRLERALGSRGATLPIGCRRARCHSLIAVPDSADERFHRQHSRRTVGGRRPRRPLPRTRGRSRHAPPRGQSRRCGGGDVRSRTGASQRQPRTRTCGASAPVARRTAGGFDRRPGQSARPLSAAATTVSAFARGARFALWVKTKQRPPRGPLLCEVRRRIPTFAHNPGGGNLVGDVILRRDGRERKTRPGKRCPSRSTTVRGHVHQGFVKPSATDIKVWSGWQRRVAGAATMTGTDPRAHTHHIAASSRRTPDGRGGSCGD